MIQGKTYRICHDCRIPHFENCESCFGFGLVKGKSAPIPAVAMGSDVEYDSCPECHSTPMGLPAGILEMEGAKDEVQAN